MPSLFGVSSTIGGFDLATLRHRDPFRPNPGADVPVGPGLAAAPQPVQRPPPDPNATPGLRSTERVALRHPQPPYGCRDRAQTSLPASALPASGPPIGPPYGTLSPRTVAATRPKRYCRPRVRRLGRLAAPSAPARLPRPSPNDTSSPGSAEWVALRHAEPPYDCRDQAQTTPPASHPQNGSAYGTLSPCPAAATGPKRAGWSQIRRTGRLTAHSAPVPLPQPGPNVTAGRRSTERAALRHAQHLCGCRDRTQTCLMVSDPLNGSPHGTPSPCPAAATGPKRHPRTWICTPGLGSAEWAASRHRQRRGWVAMPQGGEVTPTDGR